MSEALQYLRQSMSHTNLPEHYYENEIAELMQEYADQQVEEHKKSKALLSLPTDEEIKKKAFDLSYVYRDDDDCTRSDAVEISCEEMGHWMKNKLTTKTKNRCIKGNIR